MSLHPNPKQFADETAPHAGHRLFAAAFTTIPATVILTATLWALAGACTSGAGFGWAAAMIFAGFLPFSLTTQYMPGTATSGRMRRAKTALISAFFALFVVLGSGPLVISAACGAGPSAMQFGLLVTVVSWGTWWGLRAATGTRA